MPILFPRQIEMHYTPQSVISGHSKSNQLNFHKKLNFCTKHLATLQLLYESYSLT